MLSDYINPNTLVVEDLKSVLPAAFLALPAKYVREKALVVIKIKT